MENLNCKDRYLRALKREPVDRVPVPAYSTHPLLQLMDHIGIFAPGIHFQLDSMVDFALAGYEVLGFEGVKVPIDGVFEVEAMGCPVDPGSVDRNPHVAEHPFSIGEVNPPGDILERARIPLLLQAVQNLRGKVSKDIPLTSHFMGPTTISCHLVGPESFLSGLIRRPLEARRTLDGVTELCIRMGNALAEAGADVLEMPDPMASSEVISPKLFSEMVLPCYRMILRNVACPVVLHICGDTNPLLPTLKGNGILGYSFDSKVSIRDAKNLLGDEMSLIGNISATDTLLWGSKEDVERETTQAIRQGIDVVAPSCGFAPQTPLENVREMVRAVKSASRNE